MEDIESKNCLYCNKMIQKKEYDDHILCHQIEIEEKANQNQNENQSIENKNKKKNLTKTVINPKILYDNGDKDFKIISGKDFDIKTIKGKKKEKNNEKKVSICCPLENDLKIKRKNSSDID